MSNFVKKYLDADIYQRRNLISNWLHGIKSESEIECWNYFDTFDFTLLNKTNKIELVRLTVFIEYAMGARFNRFPEWCLDERLFLQEPYLGRGYNLSWFFFGPQAFYRHNCFFDPGSLEVL